MSKNLYTSKEENKSKEIKTEMEIVRKRDIENLGNY